MRTLHNFWVLFNEEFEIPLCLGWAKPKDPSAGGIRADDGGATREHDGRTADGRATQSRSHEGAASPRAGRRQVMQSQTRSEQTYSLNWVLVILQYNSIHDWLFFCSSAAMKYECPFLLLFLTVRIRVCTTRQMVEVLQEHQRELQCTADKFNSHRSTLEQQQRSTAQELRDLTNVMQDLTEQHKIKLTQLQQSSNTKMTKIGMN